MTEQDLHDYNKWLMEVWNPKQLYIPFAIDAPNAYLKYRKEQLIIANVVGQSEQLKTMVFELANKLAIAGEGDAAVSMHRIHNRL